MLMREQANSGSLVAGEGRSERDTLGRGAPWWLPEGHSQTIWAALRARRWEHTPPTYRRERWQTEDGDFIDVDFATHMAAENAPLLVLFHGLEGSSRSHYAEAFADVARRWGVAYAVPHFRGCSGEPNVRPRAYHSGDHEEIDWMLRRFRAAHPLRPLMAVGVSLGGNALMRWAGEQGCAASTVVKAVASVCAPLDLAAGGAAIGRGLNRVLYNRMFLRTLVPKALGKLKQYPGLFDRDALLAARDLYTFDNVFTAPVHGFRNTEDYWRRASAKPGLSQVKLPALVLNARNDPFVPAASLPGPQAVSADVTLWQPEHGGHVGFPRASSRWGLPVQVCAMPEAVTQWLLSQMEGVRHG